MGEARTVAVTTLIACGLYLVMALEAEGSRRRSTLVAGMCLTLGALYAACLLVGPTRRFFALTPLTAGMTATAAIAGAVAITALWLSGFTLRADAGDGAGSPQGPRP